MNATLKTSATVLSLLALSCGQAFAADNDSIPQSDAINPGDSDSKWVLGASIGAMTNPMAGEDNAAFIAPNLEYRGEYFFIKDGEIGLSLYKQPSFSAGLVLTGSGSFLQDKDDYDDNDKLAGLEERDGTLDAGAYFIHRSDMGRLKVTLLSEVTGEHHGQSADANYVFDYKVSDWHVNPFVGATWVSDEAVDHFFGVSAAEANSNRAAYEGESSVNMYAGVRGRYEITENWDVTASAAYLHLGSGIADSSIVEEDNIMMTSVGVNYNF